MKTLITCCALLLSAGLYAQATDQIFTEVEKMPEYPGGQDQLLAYLGTVKYPKEAKQKNIEGTVYVKFVVEKNGSIGEVTIAKGNDALLNNAAMNHVKEMPAWKPGYLEGKPVRVQYIVPFKFAL